MILKLLAMLLMSWALAAPASATKLVRAEASEFVRDDNPKKGTPLWINVTSKIKAVVFTVNSSSGTVSSVDAVIVTTEIHNETGFVTDSWQDVYVPNGSGGWQCAN